MNNNFDLLFIYRENTRVGRLGVCLFTIGIYAIYTGISLLLPDLSNGEKAQIEREKGKQHWIKLSKEIVKKRSLLYYKTLVGLSFGIIFYQFSKSAVYRLSGGLGIFVYTQIYNRILTGAKEGFKDDLMVLPLTGTFSVCFFL